ncbi:restriction endonuclease subunit S [Faecalibacterium sp. 7]|uniref:restriction endonuclease subunit S n=1 Tax=Faecalibacterium sp. 7 TaxID=3402017 RepID=UPI003C2C0A67
MRKMKDSGIEWIGEIPEGWEVGQIGQLYSERRTKVSDKDYPPLSVTMKGILPQLSTAAKTDAHDDRKLVCKGDFAINSRSDRRGSCGISEQDGSISLINIVLQPRGEMNPGYYNWLFHTSMFADEFYKWGHGIVDDLWTTGWSDMKKIGVPVPSKCEQKQLAEHLNFECSNIDTILSKTRSSIEEYKKLKQAVITQAVTKGVRGERKMKDSGVECIGKIPTTYSICKLKYLLKNPLKYGANESGIPYSDSLPRYIRITDITPDGNLKYTGKLSLSEESAKDYILEDGDILFARSGATVGKTFIYYQSYGRSAYAGYLIKASLNNKVSPKFVYYYTCSSLYEIWKNSIFIQSTIQNIGADRYANLPVPVPKTLQEQEEIADYLDAKCAEIDGLIAKKEQLVKELESYKKSLIYEVVTGKREV